MEQLEFLYDKYRPVTMNALLFSAVLVAFICKTEKVQSLAFGLALGIALISLGESINRLMGRDTNSISQE